MYFPSDGQKGGRVQERMRARKNERRRRRKKRRGGEGGEEG